MTQRFLLLATAIAAVAACGPRAVKDDVLAETGTNTAVARTVQCVEPGEDGVSCNRKTCKKDSRSDCSIFMDRCTQSDHTYEGNADEGTCIRGDHVG